MNASPSAIVVFLCAAWSLAQEQWIWRQPLPQGNNINEVIWADGRFVAVGTAGALMFSEDGSAWTLGNTRSDRSLNDIARFKDSWVAAGDYGEILFSGDGRTWTPQVSGTTQDLLALSCFQELCVAGGRTGAVLVSRDGLRWESTPAPMMTYADFASNGKTVVGLGAGQTVIVSEDGKSWAKYLIPDAGNMFSIVWKSPLYLATGSLGRGGALFRSPDGIHWETQKLSDSGAVIGLHWNGRELVARLGTDSLLSSADGQNWKRMAMTPGRPMYSLASSGGKYLAFGPRSDYQFSDDAKTWTYRAPEITAAFRDVVWTGSRAIAVGDSGLIMSSGDGVAWKRENSGTRARLETIVWNGSLLVAGGDSGVVLTSRDGAAWARQSFTVDDFLWDAVWTGSYFAVLANLSSSIWAYVSPNGFDWTRTRLPERARGVSHITWADTQLVAFEGKYLLYTSKDGVAWKETNIGSDSAIQKLSSSVDFHPAWNGKEMVIPVSSSISNSIDFLTSRDLIHWSAHVIDSLALPTRAHWSGEQFIFHQNTEVVISRDMKTFTRQKAAAGISALAWDGKRYISVGAWGTIQTSPLPGDVGIVMRPLRTGARASAIFAWRAGKPVFLLENGRGITLALDAQGRLVGSTQK